MFIDRLDNKASSMANNLPNRFRHCLISSSIESNKCVGEANVVILSDITLTNCLFLCYTIQLFQRKPVCTIFLSINILQLLTSYHSSILLIQSAASLLAFTSKYLKVWSRFEMKSPRVAINKCRVEMIGLFAGCKLKNREIRTGRSEQGGR